MLVFFTIASSNERRPPVYTLHLKCFAIKGEPHLVENISYGGYSPPKCTCNGHVPHIHIHIQIPSKNMQFLLWNPTCHAMKIRGQSCTMPRVLTDSHHTRVLPTPITQCQIPCVIKSIFWITSNDHFTKQIHLFSNQNLFGCYTPMIIYIQNSCVFYGQ